MRSLVTGGLGFLGSALARALVERGDRVVLLDLPGADPAAVAGIEAELVEGDVRDRVAVERAVKGCQRVFHTAALVGFWRRRNARQWDVNVNGTRTVLEACLRAGVGRVVHTSSVNALGTSADPARPADEETPFNWGPQQIGYMDSKHAAEELALELARERDLPAVIVEPGTIFGPGESRAINANSYLVAIAGRRLPFYPPGGTNCVGIGDVVRGQILAAEKGRPGERYILGGENLSYREMFAVIAGEIGVAPPRLRAPRMLTLGAGHLLAALSALTGREPVLTPEMVRAGFVYNFYSSAKAQRELGYSFKPFREVVRETVRFLFAAGRLRTCP